MILFSVFIYLIVFFFFFKQKTAYEMRISDWSSDVCSSDLIDVPPGGNGWLHTELTSRFCAFRLEGLLARDVLSAGANLHGVRPGMGCRMAFAESAAVVIQCFAADEYRLMVDVGLAAFMAKWPEVGRASCREGGGQ